MNTSTSSSVQPELDGSDLQLLEMCDEFRKTLSPNEIEMYKQRGEELYGNVDYENTQINSNVPPPVADAIHYIREGIASGLELVDLDDDEKALLESVYGNNWHEHSQIIFKK